MATSSLQKMTQFLRIKRSLMLCNHSAISFLKVVGTTKSSPIYRSFPFFQSKCISTCPLSFNKSNKHKKERNIEDLTGKHDEGDEVEIQELDTDVEYKELVHRAQLLPGAGHQVFIIQPYIKWGPKKRVITTPDLMLEEATALIDSLSAWSCVDSIKTPLLSMGKKLLFGTGKLEELQKIVRRNSKISAIFVSVNQLTGLQREELFETFQIPIFDRYSIVLQIFKERAKTQEAKLQVAFAEIPYLRTAVQHLQTGAKGGASNQGGGKASIRGSGETYFEIQVRLLDNREHKIKNELQKLARKRATLKQQRIKKEFPVVAILGYTNCGKTTLIKALTGDHNLEPKDALFATLDVTTHACRLPCNLSTLLVDTVGFISDIPTNLIAAFNATLRDALDADVLVHIHDASHPDLENQIATVDQTLAMLNTDVSNNLIRVANKIDILSPDQITAMRNEGIVPISAKEGTGLNSLLDLIQEKVLEVTERNWVKFRVPNGGEEYAWLNKETAVVNCIGDASNEEFLIVEAILTKAAFGKFKSKFPRVKMSVVKINE